MWKPRKQLCQSLIAAGILTLAGSAVPLVANAGIFGALDDLANAAQNAGVNVPNSVYDAQNAIQDTGDAAQQLTPQQPSPTQIASPPACPPGYTCSPQQPAPVACPPGDICRPQEALPQTTTEVGVDDRSCNHGMLCFSLPANTHVLSNAQFAQMMGWPILAREQEPAEPYRIRFVMPTAAAVAALDPLIDIMEHGPNFLVSRNNAELPYQPPERWEKYIIETDQLWPSAQQIPTETLLPGDPHGGLYRISSGRYTFFTQHAVRFFMGGPMGNAKIFQTRHAGGYVPNLWVILDPDCTLSHDFFLQAEKYANAGKIDIHAVIVGMDAGSPGRAEAILSSRVPGASGAGVGEMAQYTLAQDFENFSYSPEQGGIQPMHGDAAARHLVHVNDQLAFAVSHTYSPGKQVLIVYPTMLFRSHRQAYVYADIHSSPIWYTALLNHLAAEDRP